jgi:hypothetical protein
MERRAIIISCVVLCCVVLSRSFLRTFIMLSYGNVNRRVVPTSNKNWIHRRIFKFDFVTEIGLHRSLKWASRFPRDSNASTKVE